MKYLQLDAALEGAPRVFLVATAFHLSACILYLLGYSAGFGGNLISLASAADIFAVGLRDLSWIYAVIFFIPAITRIGRIRQAEPYAEDQIRKIADPSDQNSALRDLDATRLIMRNLALLISLFIFIIVVISFYKNMYFSFILIGQIALISSVIFQEKIKSFLNIDYKLFEILDLMLAISITTLTFSAFFGNNDRKSTYNYVIESSFRCGDFAIIRSISDKYIAAQKQNNSKHIIDEDCVSKFQL